MSVNAGMRNVPDTPSNRQCNAVESALALCLHTIKICSNRNIFTVEYIDIVSMAVNVSMEIYLNSNTANNIRVTDSKSCKDRLEMEYNALTLCKTLIGIINISQRLFHLRMKKNKKDKAKADEYYSSWKAHAKRGQCYKLFKRLNRYYNELWRVYESNQTG